MTEKRMTDDELTEEARRWDTRELTPAGWEDAPDAVPRAKESTQINIRLPRQMVEILKEFARRLGIGYQVLMKRWLDERIRQERERLRLEQERLRRERERAQRPQVFRLASPTLFSQAASFDASHVNDLIPVSTGEGRAGNDTPVK
jgi:predicted DNA binding CopG/RHH family protein